MRGKMRPRLLVDVLCWRVADARRSLIGVGVSGEQTGLPLGRKTLLDENAQ